VVFNRLKSPLAFSAPSLHRSKTGSVISVTSRIRVAGPLKTFSPVSEITASSGSWVLPRKDSTSSFCTSIILLGISPWDFYKTESNPPVHINPIGHAITMKLLLYQHILSMGFRHIDGIDARNLMDIHVNRHS
jgi:hypothetical protein